jgi:acetoin utilization deacetylase AcuC-like enzyme
MATGLVYHDIFLEHGEPWHPENRKRLEAIVARLQGSGLWNEMELLDTHPAGERELMWLHDEDYLEELRLVSERGGGQFDPDTIANWATWGAATVAAGSCMAAVQDMIEGGVDNALCLVRPPGHHARPSQAMGFCFLNNAALAAEAALRHSLQRVAIFDFDVHHGNGTQEMFYHRGDVLYVSIHEREIYPGTGTVDEVGVDAGMGLNVNVPLPRGAQDQHYLRAMQEVALPVMRRYQPELIVVSAGYDGHHTETLAQHELTTDVYHAMTTQLRELAAETGEGRLCVCLEGGYELAALARGVENTALALLGRPITEPEAQQPDVHPEATARVDQYLDAAIELHKTRLGL